jgi:hypothetical protein
MLLYCFGFLIHFSIFFVLLCILSLAFALSHIYFLYHAASTSSILAPSHGIVKHDS